MYSLMGLGAKNVMVGIPLGARPRRLHVRAYAREPGAAAAYYLHLRHPGYSPDQSDYRALVIRLHNSPKTPA